MSEKHVHEEKYPLKHYRKLRKLVRRKKADVEESAENSFSIEAINDISQDEIIQTDSEEDDTETDGFFLQPVPLRLRRSLLKLSGVRKFDATEKDECKELRGSREECGCSCTITCLPETCLCAINGIQCQVDRFSFPCGCTKKSCGNPSGRVEFNPIKVRKHYRHTMNRLLDEEQQDSQTYKVNAQTEETLVKKSKHIRFKDDDLVEGEADFFNSTETGCCLDCSLTTGTSSFATDTFDSAPCSLECFVSPHQFSHNNHEISVTNASAFSAELALPSVSAENSFESTGEALEPISELLNPILNTADSLDMYSLSNFNTAHSLAVGDHDNSNVKALPEWQSLSHESLLTTNNLIPMKNDDDNSSQSSDNDELLSGNVTSQSEQLLSFSGLKSSPISFQLQTSHNVMHALHAECADVDHSKSSLSLCADAVSI